MSWRGFTETYAAPGLIRLGTFAVEPAPMDQITARATLAVADRILSLQAQASGPVGAMTSMLHEVGARVQILRLSQREVDGEVTTFLLCEDGDRRCWSCGTGATWDEANVHALVAGANRLWELAER